MSYPHRLDASEYAGYRLYSLTIGTDQRAWHFTEPAVVNEVLSRFLLTADRLGFAIIAYCFMPDHVHLVVVGRQEDADFRRFVVAAKQCSGFWFARARGGRLWQRNFFDRTIRKDDDVARLIAYIVDNPVRARLVTEPADYPYWGSQVYTRGEILAFLGCTRRRG